MRRRRHAANETAERRKGLKVSFWRILTLGLRQINSLFSSEGICRLRVEGPTFSRFAASVTVISRSFSGSRPPRLSEIGVVIRSSLLMRFRAVHISTLH